MAVIAPFCWSYFQITYEIVLHGEKRLQTLFWEREDFLSNGPKTGLTFLFHP